MLKDLRRHKRMRLDDGLTDGKYKGRNAANDENDEK